MRIAQQHPHLLGIGFDLPPVKDAFERYVRRHNVGDRLRFQGGDFFQEAMPSADVLILGHILHNWSLESRKMLLKKAYDALPPDSILIVYESLIDDERKTSTIGLLQALNMMIETPHGSNFTGAECQAWLRKAGFRNTRVEHLAGADTMIVATK